MSSCSVRNPHSLAHVAAALQTPRDRDIVVMTVRLLGVDVSADALSDATPTPAERQAALGRRRRSPSGTIGRFACSSSRPTTSSTRSSRRSCACARPTCTSANRRRSPPTSRRGCSARPGNRRARNPSTRRPARRPSPQRTHRHVSPRRPPAVPLARRSRSHPSRLAGCDQGHWPARPSSRRRQGSAYANGTTTQRTPARRGARGHSPDGATGRRAHGRASRPRLRAAAGHDAQSPRQRRGRAPDRAQPRGSGRRLPRPAAQGRRRGLRVSVAGRQGNAAQGDGAGRRRRAAQQHGARRSHDVPRRTAGDGHAPTADAADAGGTRRRA